VLELPNWGGKRHNLTSNIKRRIAEFYISLPDNFNQDKSNTNRPRRRPTNIEQSMAAAVTDKDQREQYQSSNMHFMLR